MSVNKVNLAQFLLGGGTERLSAESLALTEVSNPYNIKIAKNITVNSIIKEKPLADLSYYAKNNIANYDTITELPQEHIDYLNSVRGTNMDHMFSGCKSLTSLDVSKWDTSKVTNMKHMFSNCSSLTSLDLSNFDTSKVTDMNKMFFSCSSLKTLNVSNFDTSQVTDMSYMISGCQFLKTLDVSNWDISQVTNMDHMFNYCKNLTSLDLTNFNTANVINMQYMFLSCGNLTTVTGVLDLTSCTNAYWMFRRCYDIKIHLKNVRRSIADTLGGGDAKLGEDFFIDSYIEE